MSDDMTTIEQTSFEDQAVSFKRARSVYSGRRRLAVVGGVFAVLVVAASALFFLFGQVSSTPSGDALTGPGSANAETAQPSTAASSGVTVIADQPEEVALTEVFTFRDIFEPLIRTVSNTTNTNTSSNTNPTAPGGGADNGDDNGSGASANTILLQDITVDNGEPTAVVVWEGATYNVQEGDQIDDSPWQVLDIETSSVVMLFGDTQVVLSVGTQVSK